MWIVCLADDSHEMSRLIFSENNEKRKLICRLQQILLGALSVNCSYVKKLTFLAESAPAQKTDNANMQVYIIPGTRPEKTSLSHMYSYTRATMWEDIPSNIFAQRRLKSACACAQSDQNLRCPHEETLHLWLLEMHTVKTMIKLRECAGWSESSLGAHALRYFF